MTSFKFNRNPRRKQFMRLISTIHNQLDDAFFEMKSTKNLTKSKIAERLGVNKSYITRLLNGTSNMKLETLSNLAFEMDHDVIFQIRPKGFNKKEGSNYFINTESKSVLVKGLDTIQNSSTTNTQIIAR